MNRVLPIPFLVALMAFGFLRLRQRRAVIRKEHEFAVLYLQQLKVYYESGGSSQMTYAWLLANSVRMQTALGELGRMSYRAAASSYVIHDYPVVVNLIPELRRMFESGWLAPTDQPYQIATIIHDTVVRYGGVLEERTRHLAEDLRNPFLWLREAVRSLLATPLYLLHWAGLIGPPNVFVFRGIAGLVTLVGFVSSIITIVTGWVPFAAHFRSSLEPPALTTDAGPSTMTPTLTATPSPPTAPEPTQEPPTLSVSPHSHPKLRVAVPTQKALSRPTR